MPTTYDLLNSVPAEDIDVAPPSDYVDSGGSLLPEGTYQVRIVEFEPDFDDGGIFRKSINFKQLIVVGVTDEALTPYLGRKIMNVRTWTTTYLRNGVKVSGLGDFVRGVTLDAWTGLEGATRILQEAADKQTPIQIRFIWSAYDKEGFEAAGGKKTEKGSQEEKEIRKRCSVKGMRNFRQLPDGAYFPEVAGPVSGALLDGRLEIASVTNCEKKRDMLTAR